MARKAPAPPPREPIRFEPDGAILSKFLLANNEFDIIQGPIGSGKSGPPGPVNSVAPAVTGGLSVGSVLTVSNGTWSGTPTYTRQWYAAGAAISGATASTYTLVSGDAGKNIYAIVTATGGDGGVSSAQSNTVGPVTALPVYADFVAHINAKESPTTVTFDSSATHAVGAYKSTPVGSADGGFMYGSSWQDYISVSSAPARIIRHGVSSQAQADAIVANNRASWYRLTAGPTTNVAYSTTRNGYTSLGEDLGNPPWSNFYCTLLIWWDETLGARQRNPQGGGAETAYTW